MLVSVIGASAISVSGSPRSPRCSSPRPRARRYRESWKGAARPHSVVRPINFAELDVARAALYRSGNYSETRRWARPGCSSKGTIVEARNGQW